MMTLRVCPSTLAEGFDTYSPAARKKMFDDKAQKNVWNFLDLMENVRGQQVEFLKE